MVSPANFRSLLLFLCIEQVELAPVGGLRDDGATGSSIGGDVSFTLASARRRRHVAKRKTPRLKIAHWPRHFFSGRT
jgi:hypothetical protein